MQIFIILVIISFSYVIINFILDSKATPTTSKATLIKKEIESLVDANGVLTENYLLTFKNENNETKRYSVSYKIYKNLNENQTGALTVKRKRFVSFDPDKR